MQGAGNGRQQVDAPLAPLGVSATQESDSGVPQSESEYKGLDELLGKAKRGRDGEKEDGLTWDEESAIVSYKSGDSGKFSPNDPINLGGYLSVSMDPNTDRTSGQYTVDMVIDAKTARSINGFGANTEREAILARNVRLMPRSMERVGPYKFKITVEEYANGSGAGPRTREVNDGLGGAVLRRILFMGRRSPGSGRSSESSDGGIFCS